MDNMNEEEEIKILKERINQLEENQMSLGKEIGEQQKRVYKKNINRMYWIKRSNKFRRRLQEFTNAFGFKDKLFIGRIVDIIQIFKEELCGWQIELEWIDSFEKGNTTMDLETYKLLMWF